MKLGERWREQERRADDPDRGGTIGAILLTGFLGSGKTTLLNHLLKDPEMADTAVIINEFGDVAIDHLLVESAIENAVVLQSGCICCTVRGDLVDTLLDLLAKRERGLIPAFSRVAIETTGLADPSPIMRTFATEKAVSMRFHLQAVVATIDTVNGLRQLEEFEEARRQVAMADLLLRTKGDIAAPGAGERLTEALRRLNPSAEILPVENGRIGAARIFAALPPAPDESAHLPAWLRAGRFDVQAVHQGEIAAFSIVVDEPIGKEALERWLASIVSLRGSDILRMKGIVAVDGERGPVVIQAVQHLLHPRLSLDDWPDDDRRTRIVFITRGLPPAGVRNSFLAALRSDPARRRPACHPSA
ncbi:CobW family GTP-binding protein [Pseudochelatococcus sp. B33]